MSGGTTTLEVRWIHRGPVPDVLLTWLGPFADPIEEREDRYLVEPSSPDLGVKIKGGIQLDLKGRRGSPGELMLPGEGRGRLELWEKWSFPLNGHTQPPGGSAWLALRKVRRRRSFRVADGDVAERPLDEVEQAGCTVELTDVSVGDDLWWTLALEACGDEPTLEPTLRATAASVFRSPLPGGSVLDPSDSMSYARWLGARRVR